MRTCSALLRRQLPTAKSIGWLSAVISVSRRHSRGMALALAYLAALGMGLFAAPLAKAQSLSVLHTFQGGSSDGASPFAGLLMDSSGNLYGTTENGGASGLGTVFELVSASGTYSQKVLHSFNRSDGANPSAGLIMDSSGNLYGTTQNGGTNGFGTVFELVNSSGAYTESVLHSFVNSGGDGSNPAAALIMDASGNLYGTTLSGGTNGTGTVFELVNSSGAYSEKILYSFANSGGDGSKPAAALIMDSSGNLYGTTQNGGTNGFGTVFELVNSSGTYSEKVLHSFTNSNGDGASPFAGLIMDTSGNLYGTTAGGGTGGTGTVFSLINTSGTYGENLLLVFGSSCGGNGSSPEAGLIMDSSGNLYGTTLSGVKNVGTVFELTNLSGPAQATVTTLAFSANPTTAGNAVVLTASVTSSFGLPTGTVAFFSGSTAMGTQPVVCGSAALTVEDSESAGVGSNTITAQYTPAVPAFAASSTSMSLTINESGVVLTSGNNTLTGNQTINGTVSATSFIGDGSGLNNVTASGLSCLGCIGNQQLGISYAGSASQGGPATSALNALMLDGQPVGSYATTGANLFSGDQNIAGNLTATGSLGGSSANFTGPLSAAGVLLPSTGTATASQAFNSNALDSVASVFNSSAGAAQDQIFRWQAEPVPGSNNTGTPSATINLLFGSNGAIAETGLSVNANGTINFAPGQTLPSGGSGTVTSVIAGSGLTGGGTTGAVSLSIAPSGVNNGMLANPSFTLTAGAGLAGGGAVPLGGTTTLSIATANCATGSAITALPFTCSPFATLGSNIFSGNQNITGNIAATGGITASGSLTIGGGTRISEYVSITDSITLPAISSGSCTTFTTEALTGFTPGSNDTIALGTPSTLLTGLGSGAFLMYEAWETTTDASPTITIQVCNPGNRYRGGNSGTIRIDIFKH